MLFYWLLIILPIYSYGYFDGENYYRKAREDWHWKNAFTQAFKHFCGGQVNMTYDTSNLELLDNHVFYGTSDASKYRIFNMHYNRKWTPHQTATEFAKNIAKEHIDPKKEDTCDIFKKNGHFLCEVYTAWYWKYDWVYCLFTDTAKKLKKE